VRVTGGGDVLCGGRCTAVPLAAQTETV
jgi:hypothetical protein